MLVNKIVEKKILYWLGKINPINIIRFILLILPFTFLFYFETTLYGYLSSKILGLSIILVTVLLIIILNLHRKKFFLFIISGLNKVRKDAIFKTITLLVFLLLLSTINSNYILTSFTGSFFRWDGFLTTFCIYLYVIFAHIFLTPKDLYRLLLHTIIVSIVIFFSLFTVFNLGALRPSNYIGNPIFVSQFFMLNLFFIFYFKYYFLNKTNLVSKNLITIFFIITTLSGILISGTRGVFVGLIVATLILAVMWFLSNKKINFYKNINSKNIALVILTLTIIIAPLFLQTKESLFWNSVPVFNRLKEIDTNDTSTNIRLINNKVSYTAFINMRGTDLLLGVGPEMYVLKWFENYDPLLNKYEQTQFFDRAHNIIFDLVIMRGILGFLIFLIVMYVTLKHASKKDFVLFSLTLFIFISYMTQGLFEFDSYTTTMLLFMIFLFVNKTPNTLNEKSI